MGAYMGGGGCADIGNVLYIISAGGASIWVEDVGNVPTHREDNGIFLPLGVMDTDGADAT